MDQHHKLIKTPLSWSNLIREIMKLLLTGCTGFIGRELIPLLIKEGHSLTVMSRQSKGKLQTISNDQNINFWGKRGLKEVPGGRNELYISPQVDFDIPDSILKVLEG